MEWSVPSSPWDYRLIWNMLRRTMTDGLTKRMMAEPCGCCGHVGVQLTQYPSAVAISCGHCGRIEIIPIADGL